jgi:uracil-DNA glycosylase family 4
VKNYPIFHSQIAALLLEWLPMNTQKLHYLKTLDIQTWQLRVNAPTALDASDSPRAMETSCSDCDYKETSALDTEHPIELMIIIAAAETPAKQPSNALSLREKQLLIAMLQSININIKQTCIIRLLKCSPTLNSDSLPKEVNVCPAFLAKHIALVKPTLLLVLGNITAQQLLNSTQDLRGILTHYDNTPLLVTYHPAHLLKHPNDKRNAFQDLQLTAQTLKKLNAAQH